jgi:phosphoribosylformylglycinamidine synthase
VRRIERGVRYAPAGSRRDAREELEVAAVELHDRMTEAVIVSVGGRGACSRTRLRARREHRAACERGRCALERANATLGLALVRRRDRLPRGGVREARRDPTDVELMMFAQANSEHCRHKIFNADWIVDGERSESRCSAMIRNTSRAPAGVLCPPTATTRP